MAEADDYESLPATTPFKYVALAGAAAGVAEHVALFPVDSVKVGHRLISPFREIREFYLEKLEWDSSNRLVLLVYLHLFCGNVIHAPFFESQGHIYCCHFVTLCRKL